MWSVYVLYTARYDLLIYKRFFNLCVNQLLFLVHSVSNFGNKLTWAENKLERFPHETINLEGDCSWRLDEITPSVVDTLRQKWKKKIGTSVQSLSWLFDKSGSIFLEQILTAYFTKNSCIACSLPEIWHKMVNFFNIATLSIDMFLFISKVNLFLTAFYQLMNISDIQLEFLLIISIISLTISHKSWYVICIF